MGKNALLTKKKAKCPANKTEIDILLNVLYNEQVAWWAHQEARFDALLLNFDNERLGSKPWQANRILKRKPKQ